MVLLASRSNTAFCSLSLKDATMSLNFFTRFFIRISSFPLLMGYSLLFRMVKIDL
jgi:hypothetical protein